MVEALANGLSAVKEIHFSLACRPVMNSAVFEPGS